MSVVRTGANRVKRIRVEPFLFGHNRGRVNRSGGLDFAPPLRYAALTPFPLTTETS